MKGGKPALEDLLSVIVFVLYLVAVTAAGKNKKNKKKQQRRTQSRMPQFEQAFEQVFESISASVRNGKEKDAAAPAAAVDEPEGTDPCHESMLGKARPSIRYNSVSQIEMHEAGEGEDPCHVLDARDDLREEDSPVYRSSIFNAEDSEAFANDIVRGVIMSEVLKRPSERQSVLGMKRRA